MNPPPIAAATLNRACLHCQTRFSGDGDFCCAGCYGVYQILQTKGLGKYYCIPNRVSSQVKEYKAEYQYLDHEAFQKTYVKNQGIEFYIEGIQCQACIWLLEKLPEMLPDQVKSARVNLGKSLLTLELKPDAVLSQVATWIHKLGYIPHPVLLSNTQEFQSRENRKSLIRVGVAAAGTGNIMLLAISIYGGANGFELKAFHWISFFIYLPVLFYSGQPLLKSFWSSIRIRKISIDTSVVLGILLGSGLSFANLLLGRNQIYFDSLAALVFLMIASRHFLKTTQRAALGSAGLLHFLTPAFARMAESGKSVPMDQIKKNDLLEVRAGDTIPVDGEIVSGAGSIQSALLNGESDWHEVGPGSRLEAGTLYQGQILVLRVSASGVETRLGQIVRDIEQSALGKAQIQVMGDQWATTLLALILTFAAAVLLYQIYHGNLAEGLHRAIALSVVACPCGFALATPLAWALGLQKAAQVGILVKGPDVLEKASQIQNIIFDKTGTLTEGRPEVENLDTQRDRDEIFSILLSLESNSNHPVAQAICRYVKAKFSGQNPNIPQLKNFQETIGIGVRAEISGRNYEVKSLGQSLDKPGTHVGLFEEGLLIANLTLRDALKADTEPALEKLKSDQKTLYLISGDHSAEAHRIGSSLGIARSNIHGEMTPEKKREFILSHSNSMMIGDGANDAAALATAEIGVAVHGGMEVCLRAGDIYFAKPGLNSVCKLIEISKNTLRVVWTAFWISGFYNLIGVTLATMGWVKPLSAAIIMPINAISITLVTLGLSKFLNRRVLP